MQYNQITFQNIKPLSIVNQLMDNSKYQFMVICQYDDILDYYLLIDINQTTLQSLAYYLYIAYDIKQFNQDNIRFIKLYDDSILNGKPFDIMNSYNNNLINDDNIMDSSLNY